MIPIDGGADAIIPVIIQSIRIRISITEITDVVAIHIQLCRVVDRRAIVIDIRDSIQIRVDLEGPNESGTFNVRIGRLVDTPKARTAAEFEIDTMTACRQYATESLPCDRIGDIVLLAPKVIGPNPIPIEVQSCNKARGTRTFEQ